MTTNCCIYLLFFLSEQVRVGLVPHISFKDHETVHISFDTYIIRLKTMSIHCINLVVRYVLSVKR